MSIRNGAEIDVKMPSQSHSQLHSIGQTEAAKSTSELASVCNTDATCGLSEPAPVADTGVTSEGVNVADLEFYVAQEK